MTCVSARDDTVTRRVGGVVYPGTDPKLTLYVPGSIDCHMPQSFRGTPFTKIVAGTAGFVVTRRGPCTTKFPRCSVVRPASTSTVAPGGSVNPGTPEKEIVYVPGATFHQFRPQSSRGMPFTRIVAGTGGSVVTRRSPNVAGSGPVPIGFPVY